MGQFNSPSIPPLCNTPAAAPSLTTAVLAPSGFNRRHSIIFHFLSDCHCIILGLLCHFQPHCPNSICRKCSFPLERIPCSEDPWRPSISKELTIDPFFQNK